MAAVSGKLRRVKRDMEAWVGESLENKPEGNHLDDHKYLTFLSDIINAREKTLRFLYLTNNNSFTVRLIEDWWINQ